MNVHFLIEDVDVQFVDQLPKVSPVLYQRDYLEVNEDQFYLRVKDVGEFYCEKGKTILVKALPIADKSSVELYLNGSVLGAILQQRRILALHASSFYVNKKTIILCGESGFGKSSIALATILKYRGELLTDDITPIESGKILPISEKMKVWADTLESLKIEHNTLEKVHSEMDKYYLDISSNRRPKKPDIVLIGNISNQTKSLSLNEITGAAKFEYLFKNQYWEEITDLSQEMKRLYFLIISELSDSVKMYNLTRSSNISASETGEFIYEQLLNQQ